MSFKDKIKKGLKISTVNIDQVLVRISSKLQKLKKEIQDSEINIKDFSKKYNEIESNIKEIQDHWLRKIANSRYLIEDIELKVNRLEKIVENWKSSKENLYLNQAKLEFETLSSIIPIYKLDIDEMPYEDAGLTVMGIILAFFPIIHVLCIPIGVSLFFRDDYRSKIGGFAVLLTAAINLLYYILVSFFII